MPDTEDSKYVYGVFRHFLVRAEDSNTITETPENINVDQNKTENKIGVTDSDVGAYEAEEELQDATSENVLHESAINVPDETTARSDINDETTIENGEISRLLNDALHFLTNSTDSETTDLNSEAATEEPLVNTDLLNQDKDVSNLQTVSPSIQFPHLSANPSTTILNPKTLHKLYRNIHSYMNTNELEILIHHFGEHKMQFLDYILGSLDTVTDEHDSDTSILLDIERLLNYHTERLTASSITSKHESEENDKSVTFIALQKLELVLEKVKEAFNMTKNDSPEHEQKIWISKDINQENRKEIHDSHGQISIALEFLTSLTVQTGSPEYAGSQLGREYSGHSKLW